MNEIDVLAKYQERLVNISGRNRSLVLNKLYQKRQFDILTSAHYSMDNYLEFIKVILKDEGKNCTLLEEPMAWYKRAKKEAKPFLDQVSPLLKTIDETIEKMNASDKTLDDQVNEDENNKSVFIKEIDTQCQGLYKVFESSEYPIKFKVDVVSKDNHGDFESYFDDQLKAKMAKCESDSKALKRLNREIIATFKENGMNQLKLGVYFVEGLFNDGTKCRAPLFFLNVELLEKNGAWLLKRAEDDSIEINEVFIQSIKKANAIKQVEALDLSVTSLEDIKEHLKKLSEHGITIDAPELIQPYAFTEFKEILAKDYTTFSKGILTLKPYLVLGDFPKSNAIYKDYENLLKTGHLSKSIMSLLGEDTRENDGSSNAENKESRTYTEHDLFYMSPLDYSQELTVIKANRHDNLVIFGPPGTGKSQTITNIVADQLAKGKKVLVVSQKRAALDVIYNRLEKLQDVAMLIHDPNQDKKEFYQKIAKTLERLEEQYGDDFYKQFPASPSQIESYLKSFEDFSSRIENNVAIFDHHYKVLYQDKIHGYTGQELLLAAYKKKAFSDNDQAIKTIRFILAQMKVTDYPDKAMINVLKGFAGQGLIDAYRTLHTLEKRYPFAKHFNNHYSVYDETIVLQALEAIKKGQEDLKHVRQRLAEDEIAAIEESYARDTIESIFYSSVKTYGDTKYHHLLEPDATGMTRFFKKMINKSLLEQTESENKAHYEANQEALMGFAKALVNLDNIIKDNEQALLTGFEIDALESIQSGILEVTPEDFKAFGQVLDLYRKSKIKISDLPQSLVHFVDQLAGLDLSVEDVEALLDQIEPILCSNYMINAEIKTFGPMIQETDKQNDLVEETYQAMVSKRGLTQDYVVTKWQYDASLKAKVIDYRELKRISKLKRRIRTLRDTYAQYGDFLSSLYPCVLMGPEVVSSILPLQEGHFDVVIFDEASQMFVEDAIPTLFRGKKLIIAGDDKQLRPNSAFMVKNIEDIDYDHIEDDDGFDLDESDFEPDAIEQMDSERLVANENKSKSVTLSASINTAAAMEEESLLDLAKVTYKPAHLMFHYRSRFEELINFSNHAFYEGRLKISPNYIASPLNPPIERLMVSDGLWEARQNVAEAQKVVELVKRLSTERQNNETIGIITFNGPQKECIEDQLDLAIQDDDPFRAWLQTETNRMKDQEDVSLFVKNIENVQGDERDIIIFSTGYARNSKGKMSSSFGSLNQDGGENRLNVAISRAKQKVYVVTSFEPDALRVDHLKNQGPLRFKQYLQYAKAVSEGQSNEAKDFLMHLSHINAINGQDQFDSEFEKEVCDAIRQMGYEVRSQVGASDYRIDLAIYHPESSQFVLGIECDGSAYHSSKSAKENDVYRQKFLESRGWKMHRIWSTDWWQDNERVLSQLKIAIDEAIQNNRLES